MKAFRRPTICDLVALTALVVFIRSKSRTSKQVTEHQVRSMVSEAIEGERERSTFRYDRDGVVLYFVVVGAIFLAAIYAMFEAVPGLRDWDTVNLVGSAMLVLGSMLAVPLVAAFFLKPTNAREAEQIESLKEFFEALWGARVARSVGVLVVASLAGLAAVLVAPEAPVWRIVAGGFVFAALGSVYVVLPGKTDPLQLAAVLIAIAFSFALAGHDGAQVWMVVVWLVVLVAALTLEWIWELGSTPVPDWLARRDAKPDLLVAAAVFLVLGALMQFSAQVATFPDTATTCDEVVAGPTGAPEKPKGQAGGEECE